MLRLPCTPRPNWQSIVERQGLTFHTLENGQPYWNESAHYQFSAAEIDTLEATGNLLQGMCLEAAQHVIDHRLYPDLGIPASAIPAIEQAWNAEPPSLYGRFDLLWAGAHSPHPPKLLEYNADTPTSLLEAAVIQWNWLGDLRRSTSDPTPDQFNFLHERLVAKWKDITPFLRQPVTFAGVETDEDTLTLAYLEDTARQAGLQTRRIRMRDIGWNQPRQTFVDLDEQQIPTLFKLYPWESLLAEPFGPHALTSAATLWIEPIWKLLLSNKGILPILWKLFPNHPNLLEAHATPLHGMSAFVRKPLFSREGANLRIVFPDLTTLETPGPYSTARTIDQALAPPAIFPDHLGQPRYPILGLWMIDQQCSGLGIRESAGPVTDNLSCFVPHLFR